MNLELMLTYLRDLKQNNNREWYHAHKAEYQTAYKEFLGLTGALMAELGKQDAAILEYGPEELTFKLVRDTRFSKDKSPYLPAFRAHISSRGKLPVPVGYFLMITPESSFLGGGLFADVFREATEMVRTYIAGHGEEWEQIITAPEFKNNFQVRGSQLKNVPKGYDKDHPQSEYLKYKSWYLEYPVNDQEFRDEESFLKKAVEIFTAMRPFNAYLNRALETFEMPKRP